MRKQLAMLLALLLFLSFIPTISASACGDIVNMPRYVIGDGKKLLPLSIDPLLRPADYDGTPLPAVVTDNGLVEAAPNDTQAREPYVEGCNIYANGAWIKVVTASNEASNLCDIQYKLSFDSEFLPLQSAQNLEKATVYGGCCNDAEYAGDTHIEMAGGTVCCIYGGGAVNANIIGETNITVTGGVVSDAAYGAGYQSNASSTNIIIMGGTVGSVFAGGNYIENAVCGDANIHIKSGVVAGNVDGCAANVNGKSSVTLYGEGILQIGGISMEGIKLSSFDACRVYTSGQLAEGSAILLSNASPPSVGTVVAQGTNISSDIGKFTYNGKTLAASGTNQLILAEAITGIAIHGDAPGTGVALTAALTPSSASAEYQWYRATGTSVNGTPIEGATASEYTCTNDDTGYYLRLVATGTNGYTGTFSTVTSATVKRILPAPERVDTEIYGNGNYIKITNGADADHTAIYYSSDGIEQWTLFASDTNDKTVTWNVYGASSATECVGDTHILVEGGVVNSVYGGGKAAVTGDASVTVTGGQIGGIVYGGGYIYNGNHCAVSGTKSVTLSPTDGKKIAIEKIDLRSVSGGILAVNGALNLGCAPYDKITLIASNTNVNTVLVRYAAGTPSTTNENGKFTLSDASGNAIAKPLAYGGADGRDIIIAAVPMGQMTLSGEAKVGGTLTAALSPTNVTASVQWYRAGIKITEGGTAIDGATGTDYTCTISDLGKYIYVIATATGEYSGTSATVTDSAVVALPEGSDGNFYANGSWLKIEADGENRTKLSYSPSGQDSTWTALASDTNDKTQTWKIFGGGNAFAVGDTHIQMTGGRIDKIYGGGSTFAADDTHIEMSGGSVSEIYGGGMAKPAANTYITVSGGEVRSTVYGGGGENAAATASSTNVTISGGTVTNVIGGSMSGTVNDVNVTVSGGSVTSSLSGWNTNSAGTVTNDIKINISGGTIGGLTGSAKGRAGGKLAVTITGGKINNIKAEDDYADIIGGSTITLASGSKIEATIELKGFKDRKLLIPSTLALGSDIKLDAGFMEGGHLKQPAVGTTLATASTSGIASAAAPMFSDYMNDFIVAASGTDLIAGKKLMSVALSGSSTNAGDTLTATLSPEGAAADFAWYRTTDTNATGTQIPGAAGSSYTLTNDDMSACHIRCVAIGKSGYVGTVTAVTDGVTSEKVRFTVHPTNTSAAQGAESASFYAQAAGTGEITYTWQRASGTDWIDVASGTDSNGNFLAVASPTYAMNGYRYRCIAANAFAAVTSTEAVLTVTLPITAVTEITVKTQPRLSYKVGDSLDLSGAVVNLNYGGASNMDVAFADFAAYSITADMPHATALTETDAGKTITFTCNEKTCASAPINVASAATKLSIVASGSSGGTVEPNGTVIVEPGGSITIKTAPNNGYKVASVTLTRNGVQITVTPTNGEIRLEDISADTAVTVEFASEGEEPENPATLTVVNGSGGGVYQSGTANISIVAAQKPSFEFKCWTTTDAGVIIANTLAPRTSVTLTGNATVTAEYQHAAPVITEQPQDVIIQSGGVAAFGVGVSYPEGCAFTWQYKPASPPDASWTNITGSDATLEVTADMSLNGYLFHVIVENDGGRATSRDALLTVSEKPVETGGAPLITYTYEDWLRDNQYDEIAPPSGLEPDTPAPPEDLFGTLATPAPTPNLDEANTPTPMPGATQAPIQVLPAGSADIPPRTADSSSAFGLVMLVAALLFAAVKRKNKA